MKLPESFYTRPDVVGISRELIGKELHTRIGDVHTVGIIVETEAYSGRNDKACHAYLQRRTKRTEIFYQRGGCAYVYLCYGIHRLFNIITNVEDEADAILIRAVEPLRGTEHMLDRRSLDKINRRLTGGPGSMSQAMGIGLEHYGESLQGDCIWLEDAKAVPEQNIIASPRVGIGYAEEDALLPWRFRLKGNGFTSPAK